MDNVKAIGFDLFNTLIMADPEALGEALRRLIGSLTESGLLLDWDSYKKAYREAARLFITEAHSTGKETHNRFWISTALTSLGHEIPPDDPRISKAVEAYFSAFFDYCQPMPGTVEMLAKLKGTYRLGLLSNFTHAPTAKNLMERMGLTPYFQTLLISGEIGFRKPHPLVFELLAEKLGLEKHHILYVGDDLEPDVFGSRQAGLRPVWMTYVRDHNLPVFPGYQSSQEEISDNEFPRVTDWDEFLSLLGKI